MCALYRNYGRVVFFLFIILHLSKYERNDRRCIYIFFFKECAAAAVAQTGAYLIQMIFFSLLYLFIYISIIYDNHLSEIHNNNYLYTKHLSFVIDCYVCVFLEHKTKT